MPAFRSSLALLLLFPLAGCGVGETAPPRAVQPVLAPRDSILLTPPALPEREPEPSLRQRWDAPFAVYSRGRPAPREVRTVVVLRPDTAPSAPPAVAAEPPAAPPSAPVARAPERSVAAPRPIDAVRTHRVEWGETWYGIARRYRIAPGTLGAANPGVDPERLRAGEALRIPAADGVGVATVTHEVGPGDSLWGIARRYGVSIDRIRQANRLDGDRVRLGQTLIIPAGEESR